MTLLDVQWCSDHLASLGAIAIPRRAFLARLAAAS
jgi:Leu/Phe-tRNA-protein transferase